ncbi:hypothetical protein [Methylobacterium sp. J-077]|uniref:hypothetical protein n=1 Tax=Methylobacterium sp. J-077 TaxID=2836656 RepID=UPI001FBA1AC8|nr:hypothetical protein [Methylobacterium sp. J-077]
MTVFRQAERAPVQSIPDPTHPPHPEVLRSSLEGGFQKPPQAPSLVRATTFISAPFEGQPTDSLASLTIRGFGGMAAAGCHTP